VKNGVEALFKYLCTYMPHSIDWHYKL